METHIGIRMLIIGDGMADFTTHTFMEIRGEIMGITEIILTDDEIQIMLTDEEIQTELLETIL